MAARSRLACPVKRLLRACWSCWSTSGLSITASSCPCLTCAPISKYHFFRYPFVRAYIGDVMNGCTFPGRMISSVGAVCVGETTDTAVRATCAVSALRVVRALTRDQIPDAKSPPTTITTIARSSHDLRERVAAPTWFEEGVCASIRFVSSVWGNIVTPHGLAPRARFRFGPDAGVNLAER